MHSLLPAKPGRGGVQAALDRRPAEIECGRTGSGGESIVGVVEAGKREVRLHQTTGQL